jgi:hypothetical protein
MGVRASIRVFLLSVLCLFAATAGADTTGKTSNKWRIEFSGGAESEGTVVVQLLAVGAVVAEVPVQIAKGTGENKVARTVRDALGVALGDERYKVEVDDGEDVLIKKRHGVEDFEVRIPSNTVKGVRANLQRE